MSSQVIDEKIMRFTLFQLLSHFCNENDYKSAKFNHFHQKLYEKIGDHVIQKVSHDHYASQSLLFQGKQSKKGLYRFAKKNCMKNVQ